MGILMYILKMIFVYKKFNKLNIKKTICGVYLKSLLPIGVSLSIGFLITKIIIPDSWIKLFLLIIVYSILYILISFLIFFSKDEKRAILNKTIYKSTILTTVFNFLKAKGKYGVPIVFVLIPTIFSMFCSNYPIDKISLLFAVFTFLITFVAYVYFVFPFYGFKKNRSAVFNAVLNSSFLTVFIFIIVLFINFFVTNSYSNIFGYCRILLYILSGFFISQTFSF